MSLDSDCISHMHLHGVPSNLTSIQTTGKPIRFATSDKPKKKNGWYSASPFTFKNGEQHLICTYGRWDMQSSKSVFVSWESNRKLSLADQKNLKACLKKQAQAESLVREIEQKKAAEKCLQEWERAATEHVSLEHIAYCESKKIEPQGVKFGYYFEKPSLLIPLYFRGELCNLQKIYADEKNQFCKRFTKGARKMGAFFMLGCAKQAHHILVAEGYSTACSISQAFQGAYPVVAAMDAGNLLEVCREIKMAYPNSTLLICGDNDIYGDRNTGKQYAEEASQKTGAKVVFPEFKDLSAKPTDFNDLHTGEGMLEVRRQIETQIEQAAKQTQPDVPEYITRLNSKYALLSSVTRFMRFAEDGSYSLLTRQDMQTECADYLVQVGEKMIPAFNLWLKDTRRRRYERVDFDPSNNCGSKVYNTFKGWTVKPKKGDCSLWWQLVNEAICAGNAEMQTYFCKWCALMIQKPSELPRTCIVLRGTQGVGKGVTTSALLKLTSPYSMETTGITKIGGRFNGHVQNKIFISCDEAKVSKYADGDILKRLITETNIELEAKGRDAWVAKNYTHLMVSTNHEFSVPVEVNDRRYLILDVSDKFRGDYAFFQKLIDQMENGGYEALMHDLMHTDLTDFRPQEMPKTESSVSSKLESECSVVRFVAHSLEQDDVFEEQKRDVSKAELYDEYSKYCDTLREPKKISVHFWKKLRQLFGDLSQTHKGSDGARQLFVQLPEKHQAEKMMLGYFS